MSKRLMALPDLCTGCQRCAYVCSAVHEGLFQPRLARVYVHAFAERGYSVPCVCFQCPEADCLAACPEEAIYRDDQGVVLVDKEKCTGCGLCAEACAYGQIDTNNEGLAYKCDLCGGDPACVKECHPQALVFAEPDEALTAARDFQMGQRVDKGDPESRRGVRSEWTLLASRGGRAA